MRRDVTTDDDLERALLCCLICNPSATPDVLEPDDFWCEYHQAIFAALKAIPKIPEQSADLNLLKRQLVADGHDWDPAYIGKLTEATASSHHLQFYAVKVLEMSQRRKVLRLLRELKRRACDPTVEIASVVEYGRKHFARSLR